METKTVRYSMSGKASAGGTRWNRMWYRLEQQVKPRQTSLFHDWFTLPKTPHDCMSDLRFAIMSISNTCNWSCYYKGRKWETIRYGTYIGGYSPSWFSILEGGFQLSRAGQGREHRSDSDFMKPPFPYESGKAARHTYDRLMSQHTAQSWYRREIHLV